MICLRFQVNDARLNSRVNSLPLRPRTISFEGIKSWNSVHIGSDTSCSFFPLLLYSACIYSSLFFSTLFFLLYLLHPSDSFLFSSLLFSCSLFKCTCPKFNCNSWYRISFEGIKSWVNSVLIDSATSCSFSWYGISWEGIKSWVNSVLIDSDTSCSFFPLLAYPACIYSSLLFSTLLFLLYLLHPSDSFPFSSLLFSCSLFKCNCPKFNCNSWYRISWEGHEILSSFCSYWLWYLLLFLPSSSLLCLYIIFPSLFNSFVSPLHSPSFWFFPFLLSTLFM